VNGTALDLAVIAVVSLSVSLGVVALIAIYCSMPSPRRAVAPAPVDRPGYTYTCYCYNESVRVLILDSEVPRRRHARHGSKPARSRSRPVSSPNAGAAGGRGGNAPVPMAA